MILSLLLEDISATHCIQIFFFFFSILESFRLVQNVIMKSQRPGGATHKIAQKTLRIYHDVDIILIKTSGPIIDGNRISQTWFSLISSFQASSVHDAEFSTYSPTRRSEWVLTVEACWTTDETKPETLR